MEGEWLILTKKIFTTIRGSTKCKISLSTNGLSLLKFKNMMCYVSGLFVFLLVLEKSSLNMFQTLIQCIVFDPSGPKSDEIRYAEGHLNEWLQNNCVPSPTGRLFLLRWGVGLLFRQGRKRCIWLFQDCCVYSIQCGAAWLYMFSIGAELWCEASLGIKIDPAILLVCCIVFGPQKTNNQIFGFQNPVR